MSVRSREVRKTEVCGFGNGCGMQSGDGKTESPEACGLLDVGVKRLLVISHWGAGLMIAHSFASSLPLVSFFGYRLPVSGCRRW